MTYQPINWRIDAKPQDASLRLQTHGPIQPMTQPRGWLRRLLGVK